MPIVRTKGPVKFTAEDLARHAKLAKMPDSAIDFSDNPELTEEWFKKAKPFSKHGGARPNAGRKPSGHIRTTLSLAPAVRRRLIARAKREGKTMSEVVSELL